MQKKMTKNSHQNKKLKANKIKFAGQISVKPPPIAEILTSRPQQQGLELEAINLSSPPPPSAGMATVAAAELPVSQHQPASEVFLFEKKVQKTLKSEI
jgi:hypothetical protein